MKKKKKKERAKKSFIFNPEIKEKQANIFVREISLNW